MRRLDYGCFLISSLVLAACSAGGHPSGADVVDGDGKGDDAITSGAGSIATITCDFGNDAETPAWNLGALSFRVKLGSKRVLAKCVAGKECMLDGDEQTFSLVGLTRWEADQPARFSKGDTNNVSKIFLTGSTGDDLEPSVFITYMGTEGKLPDGSDRDAYALLIVNDGQYINGVSKAVGCTSKVE